MMIFALVALATFDITYIAPRANEMDLVYALKQAASDCSVDSIAEPLVAWVEAEPTDQASRNALDEQTLDLMKNAGFAPDRELHPVTFEAIRTTLITRTYMRVAFSADADAKICLDKWFEDKKFTKLAPDQVIPDRLR
jgi:hypothetical protein